ncbi:MAG: hypothetical protein FWD57_09585 [Polyangiaceae bacterium]|nr:hypothetical protein [Polyangiaceae bacterium]
MIADHKDAFAAAIETAPAALRTRQVRFMGVFRCLCVWMFVPGGWKSVGSDVDWSFDGFSA